MILFLNKAEKELLQETLYGWHEQNIKAIALCTIPKNVRMFEKINEDIEKLGKKIGLTKWQ